MSYRRGFRPEYEYEFDDRDDSAPRKRPRPRVESHVVSFNWHTRHITCSCLAGLGETRYWCRVIMEYVNKKLDINILDDIIGVMATLPKSDNIREVLLPVMPRAVLPLFIQRVPPIQECELEPPDHDYRISFDANVYLWHQSGDGFRPIVSEFFAYLNSSSLSRDWKEAVQFEVEKQHGLGAGSMPKACPGRFHDHRSHRLLATMVDERLDKSGLDPEGEEKNLQYLSTLNAFYSLVHGKCYGCFVAYDPKKDVPVL